MLCYGKPAQYALRALSFIALADRAVQAAEVASAENIPQHFLSKLLKQLANADILQSIKGPGGGFTLICDPSKTYLIDVIRVFEKIDTALETCALGWSTCEDENPCALHNEFKHVRKDIKTYLFTTSLKTFSQADREIKEKRPS